MSPLARPPLRPLVQAGVTLLVAAAASFWITARLTQNGRWLPAIPGQIGAWTAVDVAAPQEETALLGNPTLLNREYSNPFDEKIVVQIVATPTMDAYHAPRTMTDFGYTLSAQRDLSILPGGQTLQASVVKDGFRGERLLTYYWLQSEDGSTQTTGNLTSSSIVPRFQIGLSALTRSRASCVVRLSTYIHGADSKGAQARRNLTELSRQVYDEIKRSAKTQP